MLPFRGIPQYFRKALQRATLVPHGGRDAHCPEVRTVFANVPTIITRPARLCRNSQFPFGDALSPIGWRKEDRERLADDVFPVAEDPFSPEVPIDYTPFRIEHEDRVFADVLHEEPKALFDLPESVITQVAMRHVDRISTMGRRPIMA